MKQTIETKKVEIRLNFLKRILLGCVSEEKKLYFHNNDYDAMESENQLPIPFHKLGSNDDFANSYTMVGWARLCNIHNTLDYIRENKIDGDLAETGVWKGGVCIFMAEYVKLHGLNKKIFVCDSFEGLPRPNLPDYPFIPQDIELYNEFEGSFKPHQQEHIKSMGYVDDDGSSHIFGVSLEDVKNNFEYFNVLDHNVVFIKGWFKDTLVNNNLIDKLSLLRLDGDLFSSTIDVLNNLYGKVSEDGVIVIDDYCLNRCKEAVTLFISENHISANIQQIDTCGIYWYKKI